MEYKVGDKVKIREDLKMYKTYNGVRACEGMTKYVGRIATIVSGIGNHLGVQLDIGSFWWTWTYEMFDQNWKSESENYMKTSEFRAELKKLGYVFEGNRIMIENSLVSAYISPAFVNKIDTNYGPEVSQKVLNLIYKYAATPIAEREDEKLFNVRFKDDHWGDMPWIGRGDIPWIGRDGYTLYRDDESSVTPNKLWTLAQIKDYGIDNEEVYERVPVDQ